MFIIIRDCYKLEKDGAYNHSSAINEVFRIPQQTINNKLSIIPIQLPFWIRTSLIDNNHYNYLEKLETHDLSQQDGPL